MFSRFNDTRGGGTGWDLYVLPLVGERKPVPFLKTEFTENSARPSGDSRWLAYTSTESGREEVYVSTFPQAGSKWQISSNGGRDPAWSASGREILYISPDNNITVVPGKS